MKKMLLITGSLFLAATLYCKAQDIKKERNSNSSSILWKISGKDLQNASYLFGTIHLICKDNFLWTAAMKKALNTSKKIAFEMDLDNPEVLMTVTAGMMLPAGQSLSDYFTTEEYHKLTTYAIENLGLPEMAIQRMQPFAILSMVVMKSGLCDSPSSYEQKIMSWAKADGKEILGLETAKDQLNVIKSMNKDSTIQQIINLINNPKNNKEQYQQLLAAYLNQNLDSLSLLIRKSPDLQADLNTLLLDRNKKWIPKIEDLIHQSATFIAVGAGHLGGQGGVIALLRQAGYTVVPIH